MKICDLKPLKLLLEMHVLLTTLEMQSILNRILMSLLIAFKSFRISDIRRFDSPLFTRTCFVTFLFLLLEIIGTMKENCKRKKKNCIIRKTTILSKI